MMSSIFPPFPSILRYIRLGGFNLWKFQNFLFWTGFRPVSFDMEKLWYINIFNRTLIA